MFNKYRYLRDLEAEIIDQAESGSFSDIDNVWEYVHQDIDNQCIYYSDCFDICKELHATDWSDNMYGMEITNISQLAYTALYEYVCEELDLSDVEELIEEAVCD